MKKTLLSLLLVLFLCLSLAVTVFAQSDLPRLVDNADLLTDSEEHQLLSSLDRISEKHKLDVVVVTVYSLNGKSAKQYADDFFDRNGYGFGENYDGVLLLVSMEQREWHITTAGYGETAFTDSGIDYIADEFLTDLSNGYYFDAFNTFATLCDSFIAQAKAGNSYDYGNMPKAPFNFGLSVLVSLIIGFVIAFIATEMMKGELKTIRRKARAEDYVINGSMKLTESRDFYLYRNVNRVPKPQDNVGHSRGGSSIHRSSSGRSHGGRGGRF